LNSTHTCVDGINLSCLAFSLSLLQMIFPL
jgi:hypothetical protein